MGSPVAPAASSARRGCLGGIATGLVVAALVYATVEASLYRATLTQLDAIADITAFCGLPLVVLGTWTAGLGWWRRRELGASASGLVVCVALVYAGVLVVPVLRRSPTREIEDADRAAPVVGTAPSGEPMFAWPAMGIALTLPSGFDFVPGAPSVTAFLDAHSALDRQCLGWEWRRGDDGVVLLGIVDRPSTTTERALESARGLTRTGLPGPTTPVLWAQSPQPGVLVVERTGERTLIAITHEPTATWQVVVVAASADPELRARLTGGLQFLP